MFGSNTYLAIFLALTISFVQSQAPKDYLLPNLARDPPKPTISPELAPFFQLGPGSNPLSSLLGPYVPDKPYVVGTPGQLQQEPKLPLGLFAGPGGNPLAQLQQSGVLSGATGNIASSALQALLGSGAAGNAPPSLSPGFSVRPAGSSFLIRSTNDTDDNETQPTGSQIAGIPKIFPTLPRAPIPQQTILPTSPLLTAPEVPQGGFGPLNPPGLGTGSFGGGLAPQGAPPPPFLPGSGLQASVPNLPLSQAAIAQQQQAGPSNLYPQASVGNDNLVSQLLRTFGLSSLSPNLDLSAVNSVLGLTAGVSPNTNPGLLSNVVYSALTDSASQKSPSAAAVAALGGGALGSALGNATEIVNNKANAALIQNLLTQPNSPLCNPKPQPVETFNVDAFMGKWYQVLYSPPLSAGPCSMVTYQKLSDVGQGGPGTVFDTFEYATEATPYGKPRISSGYGIVRGTGQLIYRTTNSPSDVNVYVLETGPTNELGQYEYVVLAVNCNYPLHVFARDPVQYKQKYEAEVNSALEQRSLVSSWSRLLNLVAPVDYNLCTFPPTLFNVRG